MRIVIANMIRLLITVLFVIPLNGAASPKPDIQYSKLSIRLCKTNLTAIGQATTFRFIYLSSFSTKSDGSVENIRKIRWSGDEKVLDTRDILPCINSWRLEPNKKYLVQLSIGTIWGPNTMLISNLTDQKTLEIEL
jgi:hypothetical protein